MIHFGFKSTKAFSEKVGIPYTTIKSMLAIGTNPGYDSLLKIITAFPDVSLKWLILGEDDMLFQQMVESGQNSDHVVTGKNVFRRDFATRIQEPLDWDAMNNAAAMLLSFTDFTSFSKLHTDVKTHLCKITYAKWERSGDEWIFTITADRFLRNMGIVNNALTLYFRG